MLAIQIALSFALIAVIRSLHWSLPYQAAGPALPVPLK